MSSTPRNVRASGAWLVCLALCGAGADRAAGQEWTRFRGPNGSGVGQADGLPARWEPSEFAWKAELPGEGYGSPVAWGTNVFVLAADDAGKQRSIVCLDAQTGARKWIREFASGSYKQHARNSFASGTPAVDEERVYATWAVPAKVSLAAMDHAGNVVWETGLGTFKGNHGYAGSPIVYGELVVLANDQEADGQLVALDRRTGEVKWRVPRGKQRTTYSTPCVLERPGRKPELIFTEWQTGITGVDPETGHVNWQISVFDVDSTERAIASPVTYAGRAVGTCGFTTAARHVVVVEPGNTGRKDDVKELFRIEANAPHIPTPLVHGGRMYLWHDKGIVVCAKADDGAVVWQKRVGGNYFGSPVLAAGKVWCVDDRGELVAVAAADEFEELGRTALGEGCQSTPAIAGGKMFVRTLSHVVALGPAKNP